MNSTLGCVVPLAMFVMCVGDVTVSIHLGLDFQFALYWLAAIAGYAVMRSIKIRIHYADWENICVYAFI